MKNFLSYSLFLAATMFIASCSSDKDQTLDGIVGNYSGRNLALSVNGTIYTGSDAGVDVIGSDPDNMTFKIYNVVFGQKEYTVDKCQFRVDEYEARIFAGKSKTEYNTVVLSGKITAGKMIINIDQDGLTGNYSSATGSTIMLNGSEAPANASIEVVGTNASDIKMILKNIVPGETALEITSLTVTEIEPRTEVLMARSFKGSYKDASKEVSVEGIVQNGTMTAEVKTKM